MVQKILLIVIFTAAVVYIGRFIYRQVKTNRSQAHCDKCLPKESLREND